MSLNGIVRALRAMFRRADFAQDASDRELIGTLSGVTWVAAAETRSITDIRMRVEVAMAKELQDKAASLLDISPLRFATPPVFAWEGSGEGGPQRVTGIMRLYAMRGRTYAEHA